MIAFIDEHIPNFKCLADGYCQTDCGKGGFYGIPYGALCWLNTETGVDLRGADACETCDCIATSAEPERCGCVLREADPPAGPLLLGVLAMLGLHVRRRRAA